MPDEAIPPSLGELFNRIRAARPNPPRLSDAELAMLSAKCKNHPRERLDISRAASEVKAGVPTYRDELNADRDWWKHLAFVEEYNRQMRETVPSRPAESIAGPVEERLDELEHQALEAREQAEQRAKEARDRKARVDAALNLFDALANFVPERGRPFIDEWAPRFVQVFQNELVCQWFDAISNRAPETAKQFSEPSGFIAAVKVCRKARGGGTAEEIAAFLKSNYPGRIGDLRGGLDYICEEMKVCAYPPPPAAIPPVQGEQPKAPAPADSPDGQSKATKSKGKPPPDEVWQAWRLRKMLGKTQNEIAALLTQELKRPIDQSMVSRWLKKADKAIAAGQEPPELPASNRRTPTPLDPKPLDRGRRLDGRTQRQREQADG